MLELQELEKRIGYQFKNRALLRRATTHRSFSADHNERLEFLGDSVLGCTIGYELFKLDSHFSEGRLSRVRSNLVCEKALDEIAADVGISDFLLMGEGEVKSGGRTRPSILADLPERMGKDPKTKLQEVLQGNHLPLPAYRVVSCTGQANSQTFVCECAVEHFGIRTEGTGTNRRDAEQHAAAAALKALQEKPEAAKLKPASA